MDRKVDKVEDTPFDRTAKAMASAANRRSVMRGLAAGLLATAGGGIATNALAKKKRKKNGKKNPQTPPKTCPQGKSLAFLSVPADGGEVRTPVLEEGVHYLLRASGIWTTSNDFLHDAFAAFTFADPFSPRLFDNGVRTGLLVDGLLPDIWGSYKSNHSYGLVLIGKGEPVSLRILDSNYSGNSGVLHVEVLCAVQPED